MELGCQIACKSGHKTQILAVSRLDNLCSTHPSREYVDIAWVIAAAGCYIIVMIAPELYITVMRMACKDATFTS